MSPRDNSFGSKIWRGRYETIVSRSFSRIMGDMASDMNTKYSRAVLKEEIDFTPENLCQNVRRFLSAVYEGNHDRRFCDLKYTHPDLKLWIDADAQTPNAREIQFALMVFLEEWYPDLGYFNLVLKWV